MGNCSFCGKISGKYIRCVDCKNAENDGFIVYCKKCMTVHAPNERCNKIRTSTCDICSSPDFMGSGLCEKHEQLRSTGEIIRCKRCGTYHFYDESCPCCLINTYKLNNPKTSSCIICGGSCSASHICPSCSSEYSDKILFFEINGGSKINLLSEEYMGRYICDDGHIVKSKSEQNIDNYLFDRKIRHVYEKKLYIDQETTIHPDFYLPDMDVYIEHWGYGQENRSYTAIKKNKLKFYRSHRITLICTYETTDAHDIKNVLDFKLSHYRESVVNFEEPND